VSDRYHHLPRCRGHDLSVITLRSWPQRRGSWCWWGPCWWGPCWWFAAEGGGRRGWRVGRVLSPASRGATIHLGRPLPIASCGLPAHSGGPPSNVRAPHTRRWVASWPCSWWGLPSRAGHPARWWSLTPPFHPDRPASRTAVCSLWHCPAGCPGWVLPTTTPCGARTFLDPPLDEPRPPGQPLRATQDRRTGGLRTRPV